MKPEMLPQSPGVYVLKVSGIVLYVGQSMNVRVRVLEHRRAIRFDDVDFEPCAIGELYQLEKQRIAELKPVLNRQTGVNSRMITFREPPDVKALLENAELATGMSRSALILECIRMGHEKNGLIPA